MFVVVGYGKVCNNSLGFPDRAVKGFFDLRITISLARRQGIKERAMALTHLFEEVIILESTETDHCQPFCHCHSSHMGLLCRRGFRERGGVITPVGLGRDR